MASCAEDFLTRLSFVSYHGKTEYGKQAPPKSEFTVVVPLKRAYGSYVNHVGFVTFMITTSTGISFAIDPVELGDRMSVILTLFLTIVATKFLVAEHLPRVAFMTYLDQYFAGCFFFFILVILESVMAESLGRIFDDVCNVLIGLLWVAFNVVAIIRAERVLRMADGQHISQAWIPHGMTQRDALRPDMVRGRGYRWFYAFSC